MYFEDFEVGKVYDKEIESISFTEEEIIEHAKKYDPRPIHIDKEAAAKSRFGGIISSGFYSNMAFWGQWIKTGIDLEGAIAGVRVDHNRWVKPVCPDTVYDITVETVKKEVRREGVDGFITNKLVARDPDGELVTIYEATSLVKFRPDANN